MLHDTVHMCGMILYMYVLDMCNDTCTCAVITCIQFKCCSGHVLDFAFCVVGGERHVGGGGGGGGGGYE